MRPYPLILVFIILTSCAHAQSETTIACTMEARMCPDGSYVGRTGPDCEFAPCLGEDEAKPPEEEPKERHENDSRMGP
jgi:hypothetical protein